MPTKHYITKSLLICLIAWSATTLVTFSQTPENGAPNNSLFYAPALELPAENFELVSADGRKITVTVLSKSATGITIRNADGKEVEIAWDKLKPTTITKIKGIGRQTTPPVANADGSPQRPDYGRFKTHTEAQKATSAYEKALFKYWEEKPPTTSTEKRIKELYQEAAPYAIKRNEMLDSLSLEELNDMRSGKWVQEFSKTSATELLTKLRSPSDPIHVKMPIIRASAFSKIAGLEKDPEWEKYNIMPWDVLSKLEIKTGPEKVSLRPRFKELGVKANKEIEPICDLYSIDHLLQFTCKPAGITPPTLDKIKMACGGANHFGTYFTQKIDYTNLCGKRPVITRIQIGGSIPYSLVCEIVKHELRSGRPVISGSGTFAPLVTGFETNEAGKTSWECFDSKPIRLEEGFYWDRSIDPQFSLHFK